MLIIRNLNLISVQSWTYLEIIGFFSSSGRFFLSEFLYTHVNEFTF